MNTPLLTLAFAAALTTLIALFSKRALAQASNAPLITTRGDLAAAHPTNAQEGFSVFLTNVPAGYRDWKLISVARETANLDDVRAILGNDIAIKAYREGRVPFPEGAIIARLAWSFDASEENNRAFGQAQSFVAGAPKNGVQFMEKDSKKYAATGGWGYGHFNAGQPATRAFMQSCFPCHKAIQFRDYVFTRYSP